MVYDDPRDPLISYLSSELVGPKNGEYEEIKERPQDRYIMGVLYPVNSISDSDEDLEEEGADWDSSDDPLTLANQYKPSACGLSFFLKYDSDIRVDITAARYSQNDGSNLWSRQPLSETCMLSADGQMGKSMVLGSAAELNVVRRDTLGGLLVTLSIVNRLGTGADNKFIKSDQCLFQVVVRVQANTGMIQEYPSPEWSSPDEEDQELRLIYRNHKSYAIGHGCSTNWIHDPNGEIGYIETCFLPEHTLPGINVDATDEKLDVLQLQWLVSEKTSDDDVVQELTRFVDIYDNWYDDIASNVRDIPESLNEAKKRILARIRDTITVMRLSIEELARDEHAMTAFRMAHMAMFVQMQKSRPEYELSQHSWRAFQLAYQLVTLASLIDEQSYDREIVDLLWVPTGGGKTEAYLMLTAFEIFRRRLKHGEFGAGTAVLTRYTLRLLTSQQFQRAATLICACELERRKNPMVWGSAPITIGLWVGGDTSPNTYAVANQKYKELLALPEPQNPFQISKCSWCGESLVPSIQDEDNPAKSYGFVSTNNSFKLFCPSVSCEFHEVLPIGIVDEDLYDHPPSMLIGTIDKFARLAWEERGGVFFGGNDKLPPTLVIQDELHLITGPLGSTAGLYESAIATLMRLKGANPKVLASTATIRRPDLHVRGIFGKEVRVFPPAGLDVDDSFFIKSDYDNSRNRYIGVMSNSHTGVTSLIRISAALLQGRFELQSEIEAVSDSALDGLWTLVMYHNSLRELGNTSKYINDDIPARIQEIALADDLARPISSDDILLITSGLEDWEVPESLQKLKIPYDKPGSVSAMLCSNMFSVGVDEERLALMLVNGQPKTSSEYIQATGRIGRGRVPGLVVTHYSSQKPRDRSHYESFKRYHSALYSYVEPGSVTPFSLPSRDRALHGALVILVRHYLGLSKRADAEKFDRNMKGLDAVKDALMSLVDKIDPDESHATLAQLNMLINEWHDRAEKSRLHETKTLFYSGGSRQLNTLLGDFGMKGEWWQTLHSMRNVDNECQMGVLGA